MVRDGRIATAAQEERYDRDKYSAVLPIYAINDCLQRADASILDVDAISFYEKPYLNLGRVMVGHLVSWPFSFPNFAAMMPSRLEDRLTLPLTPLLDGQRARRAGHPYTRLRAWKRRGTPITPGARRRSPGAA